MCSGPGRDLVCSFDKCKAEAFCISVSSSGLLHPATHTNFTREKGNTGAQLLLTVGLQHGPQRLAHSPHKALLCGPRT